MENNYNKKTDEKRILQIRRLLNDLPSSCGDYIRSIGSTTSTRTRLAYLYDLRVFFTFLLVERVSFAGLTMYTICDDNIATITQLDIEMYVEYLTNYYPVMADPQSTNPQKILTNHEYGITRKLSTLRSFFDYLFKSKRIPSNVATLVPLPQVAEKPILKMQLDEITKMLSIVKNGETMTKAQLRYHKFTKQRDFAILCLFLGTGIRINEFVGLNINDFDFTNNAFLVTRKGGNQVMLYFPSMVAEAIQDYLAERLVLSPLPGNEDAMFISLQKKRMSHRAVQNMVKKYALFAAPLKKRLSPHKLRSTYATNLYHETGDIYLVADALGHANVNTTRKHYASISEERRREAAKHVILPDI